MVPQLPSFHTVQEKFTSSDMKPLFISRDKYMKHLYSLYIAGPPKLTCLKICWGHMKTHMTHTFFFPPRTCAQRRLHLLFPFCIIFTETRWEQSDQLSPFDEMSASQRAMMAATKIIYFESAQWSDTSISSRREIGRTEVGSIKATSLGKSGPFFTQRWLPPNSADKTIFSWRPALLCATQNGSLSSLNKLLQPLGSPLRRLVWSNTFLLDMFWPTGLCIVCVNVMLWIHKRLRSLLPHHWQMCNGFPVVLLP